MGTWMNISCPLVRMMIGKLWMLLGLLVVWHSACGKFVVDIDMSNLEVTLTAHEYLAILLSDTSSKGIQLRKLWKKAARLIDEADMPEDSVIAQLRATDAELKEIGEAYGFSVPTVLLFRKGVLTDYRGSTDNSTAIAAFLIEDSQAAVRMIKSLQEMQDVLLNKKPEDSAVFGLFREEHIISNDVSGERYSFEPWSQFNFVADSLRGHSQFYAVTSGEVLRSLKLRQSDLPAVFMSPSGGGGLIGYKGEVLETTVRDWILKHSAPSMGQLTMTTRAGETFVSEFFSSKKLKFVLILPPHMVTDDVLASWKDISDRFSGQAIFSYMSLPPVADVLEYFDIDEHRDLPMIAAHLPSSDSKFKSSKIDIHSDDDLYEFVEGVVAGDIVKVVRSELPQANSGPVIKAVGSNVRSIVATPDVDVLLAVVTPRCAQCKQWLPTLDLLGKAVQSEPRILIAKINAAANDIPASWTSTYPALLWFPARDKPYVDEPIPKPYWDAGHSLQELAGFVVRDSSFNKKTLKVATEEQLNSLLGDEEELRAKYEAEELHALRNEGRPVYDWMVVDWLFGEVVFDGTRWHLILAASFALISLSLLFQLPGQSPASVKKRKAQ